MTVGDWIRCVEVGEEVEEDRRVHRRMRFAKCVEAEVWVGCRRKEENGLVSI